MTDLKLPLAMAELRPVLDGIVAEGQERAPYFSVLLSSKKGLQITVDNREERVTNQPPSAGTVLSAFDGVTVYERGVSGFRREEVGRAARELVHSASFATYTPHDEPQGKGDFAVAMEIDPAELSTQEKLDRCRELHSRIKGRNPHIVNIQVIYREENEHAVFASRHADLAQRIQRVRLAIVVIVAGE